MTKYRTAYYLWALTVSSKNVFYKSFSLASDSFKVWFNTSPILKALLSNYQWYEDSEWNKARVLSDKIRSDSLSSSFKKKKTKSK